MLCLIVNNRKHFPQSILLQPLPVHSAAHPSVESINSLFVLNDPHDYYIEKTCDYRLLGNAERTKRDELNSNIQISQSASKLAIHAKIKGQQGLCNGGGTSGPHLDDRRDDESDNCTHTRQRAARCMLPSLACRHSTQKPSPDMFLLSTPVSG